MQSIRLVKEGVFVRFGNKRRTEAFYLERINKMQILRLQVNGPSQFSNKLNKGNRGRSELALRDTAAIPTQKTVDALRNELLTSLEE